MSINESIERISALAQRLGVGDSTTASVGDKTEEQKAALQKFEEAKTAVLKEGDQHFVKTAVALAEAALAVQRADIEAAMNFGDARLKDM
jgi:hypothetical protein